ncbi:MAG TPA: alpha/beta fold hydrolase [Methylomirabilota bacterium]|jgi:haloalkane dehalogenase|nr:alpha/beta fold hydrolase [Methylomirabilota bacterium]
MIPAWVDRSEYPFSPRRIEVEGLGISYVDEGEGPTLLMVHGTPSWSFLYRHLVRGLRDAFRCVALDLPGFGLSDKPAGDAYRPEDQARRLTRFIDALGLRDVTLVVHDFGGPIGLAHALERPDDVRSLVLFNTWMWSLADDRRHARLGRALATPVGRVLYERAGLSVNALWRPAVRDARYTPAVHAQYAAPLRDRAARHATWIYARELIGSSAWFDALWRRRRRIAQVPALLVWGSRDPAFAAALARWRGVFTEAEVVEWRDVGHAPPEVRGRESAALIRRFLERARTRRTA